MVKLNKIRFLFFVSLMIFPTHTLDVILSGAHQNFKQKSEIKTTVTNGEKKYRGTLNQLAYEAELGISKVIVYIISRSRCVEILRPAVSGTRSQIAQDLREMHCELVFLGIEHLDDDEYHLIAAFIHDKIQFHPDQKNFNIKTIGENRFDQFYRCRVRNFEKYQGNAQTLLAELRSIPHGAFRPVESNHKEIRLFGYHPLGAEVSWPVTVRNNTYVVPNDELRNPKYDFINKYPNKKICLLILSGKEYLALTSWGNRRAKRATVRRKLDKMTKNDEVLILFGVFNFDWTEIDIVTQIILEHSEVSQVSDYNVLTRGYGMFNTYYQNMYEGDERCIRQQPNSHVSKVLNVLMDEEPKQRAIKMYFYYDDEWKISNMTIHSINGRYAPKVVFNNLTLTSKSLNQPIAFIVYDITEMNDPIDYLVAIQSMEELKLSGITVILIEAINFGLDDVHIIAEWIDCHSGVTDLGQIAVLGGGIFDTIFQSESTTYNTFLHTKKNELETIRNACVRSVNAKRVSVANIDNSNFEVWSYPMNIIVNGFYEPDLIPDKNLFDTTNGKRIYFIITSSHTFKQISAMKNLIAKSSHFRQNIKSFYPHWKWSVFLVGLENFGEGDSHLFCELVKRQTKDERSLAEFVRMLDSGMSEAKYQYKDNAPFDSDSLGSPAYACFAYYFRVE